MMSTKKHISFVLIICVGIVLISQLFLRGTASEVPSEGSIAIEVFKQSGAQFTRVEVNGWANTGISSLTYDSALKYFQGLVKRLYGNSSVLPIKIAEEEGLYTMSTSGLLQGGIRARLALQMVGEHPINEPTEYYLTVSLIDTRSAENYKVMNKLVDDLVKKPIIHKSTVICGHLTGQLSPSQTNKALKTMTDACHAQKVERLTMGSLVSISAYSPDVRQALTLDKNSVNINMALRYNSLENKTYVYVGSPLITTEY